VKTLLPACLVALSLGTASVSAAERLSDTQMDQISAGEANLVPSCGGASMCGSVTITSSSSTVTTTNPVTGVVSTTTITAGLQTNSDAALSGLGNNGGSSNSGGSGNNGGSSSSGGSGTTPVAITLPRTPPTVEGVTPHSL